MKKYKVYAQRSETIYTYIEAGSVKEALNLGDKNFNEFDWKEVDGSMCTETIIAEEVKDK